MNAVSIFFSFFHFLSDYCRIERKIMSEQKLISFILFLGDRRSREWKEEIHQTCAVKKLLRSFFIRSSFATSVNMGRHGLNLVHSNAWENHHELPIHGVRSERQMRRLISKLTKSQQSADRIQHLVYEIKRSSQPFSGDQVIALIPFFFRNWTVTPSFIW